jgi:integrase
MLDPMDDDERERVIRAAMQVDARDWRRMEAYGLCVAAICSGLRPKEIRNTTVLDLDLNNEILHAEVVKGKGRYGEPRDSAIHPDGIPFLRRYLAARDAKLREMGLRTDTLFPAIRSLKAGRPDVYSANSTTMLRGIVQDETGVTFNLQKTRRTWGQVALDDGVPLDAVSRMMGHKTSRTTETYYARKTNNQAIAEAKAVWSKAPQPPAPSEQNPKTPLIENKKWMTGKSVKNEVNKFGDGSLTRFFVNFLLKFLFLLRKKKI